MAARKLTKKQQETIASLERLAARVGLRVSYGDLRYAGLRLHPGNCQFKGENWVVMDRRLPYEDRVDVFREALSIFDLSGEELEPDLQRILGRKAPSAGTGAGR